MTAFTPRAWVALLHKGAASPHGYVEFRFLPGKSRAWMPFPAFSDHPDEFHLTDAPKGSNVYFGLAIRTPDAPTAINPKTGQPGMGDKDHCHTTSLQWVDIDLKDHPELTGGLTKDTLHQTAPEELLEHKTALLAQVLEHAAALNLPPRAVVDSGHGLQVYWTRRTRPSDAITTEETNRALAAAFGGDTSTTDIARILRVPGSQNLKNRERPLDVQVMYSDPDAFVERSALDGLPRPAKPAPAATPAPAQPIGPVSGATVHERYAQTALAREIAAMSSTGEGGRNEQLNRSAFSLGTLIGAGILDETEAAQELTQAARAAGLDDDEIRDTLRSGLAGGKAKPRDLSKIGQKSVEQTQNPKKPRKVKAQVPRLAPQTARKAPASRAGGYGLPTFPHGTQEGTDEANAVILAANNLQNRLRYTLNQGWYAYDQARGVWMREPILAAAVAGEVLREVVGQYFLDLLKQHADKEDLERVGRWATNVCNVGTVTRALTAAAGKPEFLTPVDAWNARPELLNCPNGTLELTSGTLRPHDPADLMTWQAGAAYDPAAQHPYVERLLELLRADGRHDLLQRWAGSTLYGRAPNEKFVQLYGPGGTGKGTFADTLTAALGEYAYTIDVGLILHNAHGDSGTGPKPELLRLQGKRLVIASEPDEHARFNAGRVKGMTGNDPITARGMHSNDMVTFTPVFKLAIQTNYPIKASHDDSGLQRRMIVVPFSARPATADESFKDTLKTDPTARSAFLNWLVQGCRLWLDSGYSLGESAVVQEATAGYWKDQNPYERFAAARLTFGDSRRITSGRLKVMFEDWVAENAIRPREAKLADLHAFLRSSGCEPYRTKLERGWYGVSEAGDSGDGGDTDSPVSRNLLHAYTENLGTGVTSVTSVTEDDATPTATWALEDL